MYCVYLTLYYGNKLPGFYIGSTSIDKINNGYRGSVKSKKFKDIWKQELLENTQLFDTFIIETFENRNDALVAENLFQRINNVVKDSNFVNLSYACKNGYFGVNGNIPWNKGLSKNSSLKIQQSAIKISKTLNGRTKETFPYLKAMSQKISKLNKGKTKETDMGYAKMAKSLSLAKMKLSIEAQQIISVLHRYNMSQQKIYETFKEWGFDISYSTINAYCKRLFPNEANPHIIFSEEINNFIISLKSKNTSYPKIKESLYSNYDINVNISTLRRKILKML